MVTGFEWWEEISSAPSGRARAPAAQLCVVGPALRRSPPKHHHQDWNATASGMAQGLGFRVYCCAVLCCAVLCLLAGHAKTISCIHVFESVTMQYSQGTCMQAL